MNFKALRPGMILYDRHTYAMGNTTMRTLGEWRVEVLDVYANFATVSWNGNRPERYSPDRIAKLKTWSMTDECAEVVRTSLAVRSVKLKKGHRPPPPKFAAPSASEQLTEEGENP